jgi:TRAP-type mannitol/chloroaromatic compound transport system permease small subunit
MGEWLGRVSSWLVMAVILVVLTAVAMNAAGLNQLMEWNGEAFLFGHAITINSIIELQWHLFGLLTLIGGSYALHSNTHVRVDMFYARFSPAGKHWVDILGHALLLIPFCLLVAWYSRHFVEMSFISGERSNYGGMTDRYLIKAALPAGLILLALSALGQILDRLARLLDPQLDVSEQGE